MKEEQERTPLRTILQNFLNHVENLDRLSDDSYDKEFQSLKLFSENLKGIKQYSCTEGEKEVNKKKNRYKDILPFDYTRVILSSVAGVQGSDYVNANFIKGASGSLAYIASQGPLPHTANDFWRMVVECEVQVIVMACNEEESGKHKCENYWSDREGEERQFGMASIRLMKASVVCPDFLVRTMQLKYNKDNTTIERTVCQFHYSAWPDHGVPPLVRPLLDMVRLVRDTQASETLPVLIHCSAGCGRTGTICAIDYVWGLLRAGKLTNDFSLLKLVRDMRKQRIAMVQTKDQYILVHKAVRELFQEQLKMIDAHPYENIDLNGIPLAKEEALYERLGASFKSDEKQDNKEKEVAIQRNSDKSRDGCNSYVNKDTLLTPPLPYKKKRSHVAASKQEKEVENESQKQKLGVFAREELCKSDLESEETHSTTYSSLADSGLSASSSTDSTVTITSEPKRCPLPTSSADNLEVSSHSPSISSLLQKPRIAKLKALFERNSVSKASKIQGVKAFDETDAATPKLKTSQVVTRSHSLGAVRKPHKFSQFQSASETPVALYRKFFSTKESKDSSSSSEKQVETDKPNVIVNEGSVASSSSSNVQPPFVKKEKKANPKGISVSKSSCSLQYMAGGTAQHNVYHPTPNIQDRKPVLPVKRSKSLKVLGSVERSHFSPSHNYVMLPTQKPKDGIPKFQQQLSALIGDTFSSIKTSNPVDGGVYTDLFRSDLQVKPIPRERTKKSNESAKQSLESTSKQPVTRLSSMPIVDKYSHINGSAQPRECATSQAKVQCKSITDINSTSPQAATRNKEYVNISEMKNSWHQAGLDSSSLPQSISANNSSNWCTPSSQSTNASYSHSELKKPANLNSADIPLRSSLDEDTKKIVEDCRNYLLVSQDPSSPLPPGHLHLTRGDDMSPSHQFQSLSLEAQRKINTIVGGLGIRERRNSFRRAVCHDGDGSKLNSPKKSVKDYEPIWVQNDSAGKVDKQCKSQPMLIVNTSGEQTYFQSRPNDVNQDRIPGLPYSQQEIGQKSENFPQSNLMQSNSSISSSSASSSSGGGKRLSEFDGTRAKSSLHAIPAYHMLPPPTWESTDVRSQLQQFQQLAMLQAKATARLADSRGSPRGAAVPSTPLNQPSNDTSCPNNLPMYRRENSNVEQRWKVGSAAAGPLAPPRTKRHAAPPQRNSMIEMTEQANKDPIYANATPVKQLMKDSWHGGLGVDVDSVAASIKQTTPRQGDNSTPLTRAFEKLHTKASNLRTKLSPKSDMDTPTRHPPSPDTRQQVEAHTMSPATSKDLQSASKKQQQYI